MGVRNNNVNIVQRTPAARWRGGVVERDARSRPRAPRRVVYIIIIGGGYDRDDYTTMRYQRRAAKLFLNEKKKNRIYFIACHCRQTSNEQI